MALVYSYIRFSTKKQADGDSKRRQIEMGEEWIARTGHTAASQAGCIHGPRSYGRAAKAARVADQTPGCCAEAAGALLETHRRLRMSELDSTTQATENISGSEDRDPEHNAEYLADAYEALAEDRRQRADLAGPQHSDTLPSQPADIPLFADAGELAVVDETGNPTAETPSEDVAVPPAPDHTGPSPANQGLRW